MSGELMLETTEASLLLIEDRTHKDIGKKRGKKGDVPYIYTKQI